MARPKKTENEAETEIREVPAGEVKDTSNSESVEAASDKLTVSREELDAMIAAAVAAAMERSVPNVIQVSQISDPVILLFLGGIMPGSTVALGELGNIYRDGGTLTVSKETFFSKLNGTAEYMLRTRQLIVVSGLTEDERERVGVLYRENELLTEKTYMRLLSYDADELGIIYTALCPEHRAIVAKVFRTALNNTDSRVTPDKLKTIARIDKEAGITDSPFKTMLGMTASDTDL